MRCQNGFLVPTVLSFVSQFCLLNFSEQSVRNLIFSNSFLYAQPVPLNHMIKKNTIHETNINKIWSSQRLLYILNVFFFIYWIHLLLHKSLVFFFSRILFCFLLVLTLLFISEWSMHFESSTNGLITWLKLIFSMYHVHSGH